MQIPKSELIINHDGSVYHLNLLPEDISDTIITVGDPDRVSVVTKFFDKIELKKQKREFVTHTGYYKGKRITVMSTGIGTDNIDIVYNELDALVNIDLKTRFVKEELVKLHLIRIGTSGSLQADIPADSFVFSAWGLGLDGVLNYYKQDVTAEEIAINNAFCEAYPNDLGFARPYLTACSDLLRTQFSEGMFQGITASCSGFYGPQGRVLRGELAMPDFISRLNKFKFEDKRITNFEMETGAMYGLARILGHECCSINAIVANRIDQTHSHKAVETMDNLILTILDRI